MEIGTEQTDMCFVLVSAKYFEVKLTSLFVRNDDQVHVFFHIANNAIQYKQFDMLSITFTVLTEHNIHSNTHFYKRTIAFQIQFIQLLTHFLNYVHVWYNRTQR